MRQLIIIDCQNDFIDGSLACHHAFEAVDTIIEFLNTNEIEEVFYSLDWHSNTNQSFQENGGIWPVHCVANTHGSALSDKFVRNLKNERHVPSVSNRYLKGMDDEIEEYSAFYAQSKDELVLCDQLDKEVVIAGIASEYCVMETVKACLNAGHKVYVLKDGLGYVDHETHQKALNEYEKLGVSWL